MTTPTPTDLWHHYGRTRATTDRTVPDRFRWAWDQGTGPGAELLGELTGRCVADLGAGSARHAAHLTVHHQPERVDAVDSSPAQHAMATDLYGHLAPRLRLVHADVVRHLRTTPGAYDVLYSLFGAADFTDPRTVLPAAAEALRRGGRLVISTLGHYLNGNPAEADVIHADIATKTPAGAPTTMRRWVLQEQVWTKLLADAGLGDITVDTLPPATDGPRAAETLLLCARRPLSGHPGGPSGVRLLRYRTRSRCGSDHRRHSPGGTDGGVSICVGTTERGAWRRPVPTWLPRRQTTTSASCEVNTKKGLLTWDFSQKSASPSFVGTAGFEPTTP